jgi:hypothetical protein
VTFVDPTDPRCFEEAIRPNTKDHLWRH